MQYFLRRRGLHGRHERPGGRHGMSDVRAGALLLPVSDGGFLDVVIVKPFAHFSRGSDLTIALFQATRARIERRPSCALPLARCRCARGGALRSVAGCLGPLPLRGPPARPQAQPRLRSPDLGALADMREHRMRGVAKKRQPPLAPGGEWPAIVEAPPKAGLDFRRRISTSRGPEPAKDAASSSRSPTADHDSAV